MLDAKSSKEKVKGILSPRRSPHAIAGCPTSAMGGHRDRCDACGDERAFLSSCRDRHCPGCGAEANEAWLKARREELLDASYFHVVFTIPEILNAIAMQWPETQPRPW